MTMMRMMIGMKSLLSDSAHLMVIMNVTHRCLFLVLVAILAASQVSAQAIRQIPSPDYWPTQGWRSTTPEQQGIDSAKLADALDYIRKHNVSIHNLLIIRNGYVVLDTYFYPYHKENIHDVASVTKSVTAVLIGIAIDRKMIKSVHQPVLTIYPSRRVANRDAQKDKLTVEHLLTMSTGFDCQYEPGEPTLRQMRQSSDWVQFMLDLPMATQAGEKFVYCSGGMHLLSGIISQTTGMSALDFARQVLFTPLGIREAIWPADAHGVSHGWGDLHLHPYDMAKIGYLWLNHGMWDGKRIVSADWVAASTRAHANTGRDNDYGYGWWMKSQGEPFVYEAVGRGGQRISVVPDKNLIVVMTGGGFEPGDFSHFLLESLKTDRPLPDNQVGAARLAAAVTAASKSPAPKVITPQSNKAKTISGRTYLLEANPLGLKSLALTFDSKPAASVRLMFADDRTETHPIGLDGGIKISPGGRFNLPVGVKGYWENSEIFVLDYDEIANINRLVFRIRFHGDRMDIQLTEKSSNFEVSFQGRSSDK